MGARRGARAPSPFNRPAGIENSGEGRLTTRLKRGQSLKRQGRRELSLPLVTRDGALEYQLKNVIPLVRDVVEAMLPFARA